MREVMDRISVEPVLLEGLVKILVDSLTAELAASKEPQVEPRSAPHNRTRPGPAAEGDTRVTRRCTVCAHPDRDAIERAMLAMQPYRAIAHRHGVSRDALMRHHDDHLSGRHREGAAASARSPAPTTWWTASSSWRARRRRCWTAPRRPRTTSWR